MIFKKLFKLFKKKKSNILEHTVSYYAIIQRIIIESRYGDKRTFDQLEEYKWLVYGKSHYIRCTADPFEIDYEGGPYIGVGYVIPNTNHEVISIEPCKKYLKQGKLLFIIN